MIKKITDFLFKKEGILLLIFFSLLILFKNAVWEFYFDKVIVGLLSNIESTPFADILFFFLFIFVIILTIRLIRANIKIMNWYFIIFIILFLLCFYTRLFSTDIQYVKFYWFSCLNYFDFIFFIFFSAFVIRFCNWILKNELPFDPQVPFIVDKPIQNSSQDKLGRNFFATQIANKIQSKLKNEKSGALAVGIVGQWGSGKTSFANLIKEKIERKNRVVIDFKPWRSSSAPKIIEDFFELLISELKTYDPQLSNSITKYAKSLTKIDENIFSKSIESLSELIFEEKNKNEIYDSINESISKIKKQLIIFIDDLDRLDKKEILEVLRIIRNTANFNNVIYVVSYDKEYINTAIKDFNEYNSQVFLEKIFQFEFTLPMYDHGIIRRQIKEILKEKLDIEFHKQIDWTVDSQDYYGINFSNEIIKTYRDVIRFTNSLLFEIETIKDEILFYDFYLLQLLKLKYQKIYDSLIENRNRFFIVDDSSKTYSLKSQKEAWEDAELIHTKRVMSGVASNSSDNTQEKEIPEFENYLNEHSIALSLKNHDKNLILFLTKTLLHLKEKNQDADHNNELYKSFTYSDNFHKYFAFTLYEGDISAKEFENYRRLDFPEYKNKVAKWLDQNKYSALIDRLDKVRDFSSQLDFENHIKILLEIGRIKATEDVDIFFAADYKVIIQSLKYPTKGTKLRIYKEPVEYKNFLNLIFNSAPAPRIYESNLVSLLINDLTALPLSSKELSDINFNYFKQYCNNHHSITMEFRQLHKNSIRIETGYSTTEIIPEANSLFKKYYQRNLSGKELGSFVTQNSPGSELFYINEEWLLTIFKSEEEFEKYIEDSIHLKNNFLEYEEFVRFYKMYKMNGKKAVKFNFKFLRVNGYE